MEGCRWEREREGLFELGAPAALDEGFGVIGFDPGPAGPGASGVLVKAREFSYEAFDFFAIRIVIMARDMLIKPFTGATGVDE